MYIFLTENYSGIFFIHQIDRASAGAIKRNKEEKETDLEEEDDFGYTTSEWKDTLFSMFNFSVYLIHVYVYVCIMEHEK